VKILLDQGVGTVCSSILNAAGVECVHVRDLGMSRVPDEIILQYAAQNDFIIVTFDADFHQLLAIAGFSKPSVIRVREERLKSSEVADLVLRVTKIASKELNEGCAISVTSKSARIRILPFRTKRS
jgi:predicted nuclease of predicted toxin-antitoxin system